MNVGEVAAYFRQSNEKICLMKKMMGNEEMERRWLKNRDERGKEGDKG